MALQAPIDSQYLFVLTSESVMKKESLIYNNAAHALKNLSQDEIVKDCHLVQYILTVLLHREVEWQLIVEQVSEWEQEKYMTLY